MHDTFSKDRHRHHFSDIEEDPNPAGPDTKETRFKPLLKKKVEPLSRILGKPALGGSQKAESGSSGV